MEQNPDYEWKYFTLRCAIQLALRKERREVADALLRCALRETAGETNLTEIGGRITFDGPK